MAIKAKFLAGVTSIKIDPLHQWDCGQQLEIESEDAFPTIVEVHFSCLGMNEAEVRVSSFINDKVVTVTIPDTCLEQNGDITAWIYETDGTAGKTTKSITIPIIGRARPGRPAEITPTISDCYVELIGEVNGAVNSMNAVINRLEQGNISVKTAENAETAETAKKAELATHASTADTAEKANIATLSESTKTSIGYVTIRGSCDGDELEINFSFAPYNYSCTTLNEVILAIRNVYDTNKHIPASGYVRVGTGVIERPYSIDTVFGVYLSPPGDALCFTVRGEKGTKYEISTDNTNLVLSDVIIYKI